MEKLSTKIAISNKDFIETVQNIEKNSEVSFVVLDVRGESEIKASDLPKTNDQGASIPKINIDLSNLTSGKKEVLQLLPTDKTIFCLCRSGARSSSATSFLNQQGFKAINVSDGMIGVSNNWKK